MDKDTGKHINKVIDELYDRLNEDVADEEKDIGGTDGKYDLDAVIKWTKDQDDYSVYERLHFISYFSFTIYKRSLRANEKGRRIIQ